MGAQPSLACTSQCQTCADHCKEAKLDEASKDLTDSLRNDENGVPPVKQESATPPSAMELALSEDHILMMEAAIASEEGHTASNDEQERDLDAQTEIVSTVAGGSEGNSNNESSDSQSDLSKVIEEAPMKGRRSSSNESDPSANWSSAQSKQPTLVTKPQRPSKIKIATELTIQNPAQLKDVYIFKRITLAHGGNFGRVSKAIGKVTGAVRAVKFIPQDLEPSKMESVKSRVVVMTTLDHPNIVRLHEMFEDEEFIYLVMDCCQGGSLQDRFDHTTHFSEVQAAIVMQQALRALVYMHAKRICHRDMRAQNLLFTSKKEIDSTCLLKVSGYGSACFLKKTGPLYKKAGEPSHMAPEMANGSYGKECDLWSCGVIMYRILCDGRLPFDVSKLHRPPPEPEEKPKNIKKLLRAMSNQQLKPDQEPTPSQYVLVWTEMDENVSTSARELVALLLEVSVRARFSAEQAVHHKWLTKAVPKLTSAPLDIEMIENLRNFRSQSLLKQAALRMVAGLLNESQISASRKLFISLDADGDGLLSLSEIAKRISEDPALLEKYPDAARTVSDMVRCSSLTDRSTKKAIAYTEFIAATFNRSKCLTDQVGRLAFRCFDKNGDGQISLNELSFGHLLGGLSLEELGTTLENVDTNGDNHIDFEEFMAILKG